MRYNKQKLWLLVAMALVSVCSARAEGDTLWSSEAHYAGVYAVAFSPDGTVLASAGYDRTIRLWDVSTGVQVDSLVGHEGVVRDLSFTPDGKTLYSLGDDYAIRVWDITSRQLLRTISPNEGNGVGAQMAVYHAGTSTLVATAAGGGDFTVWNGATGAVVHHEDRDFSPITGMAFSPDGKYLSMANSGDGGGIEVWDTQTWEVVGGYFSEAKKHLHYSPDGRYLLGVGNPLSIWEVGGSPDPIRELKWQSGSIAAAVFSPNSKYIVCDGGNEFSIRIWDVATGDAGQVYTNPLFATAVAVSPDGTKIAVGCGKTCVYMLRAHWTTTSVGALPATGVVVPSVYPNPSSSSVVVPLQVGAPSLLPLSVEIVLRDGTGGEVQRQSYRAESYGAHTVQVSTAGLATGSYYCTVEANNTSLTHPIIITGE